MGCNVNVDEFAFHDHRFETLAKLLDLADADHARGKVERLWLQCTREGRFTLAEHEILAVLGHSGVIAIISARLGRRTRGGIYLKGTRGRIEWYKNLLKNAKKGADATRKKAKARRGARLRPDEGPLTLTPTLTLTSGSEKNCPEVGVNDEIQVPLFALDGGVSGTPIATSGVDGVAIDVDGKPPPSADYQDFIDHWHKLFLGRTGERYFWGARAGAQVKEILSRAGFEVACQRATKLFVSPPKFLRDATPDLGTLQAHWDKLADGQAQSVGDGRVGFAPATSHENFPETGWADLDAFMR